MKHLRNFPVSPETVRMLELGHPWIIADQHTKKWPRAEPGLIASLVDVNGNFIALALIDPMARICARVLSRTEQPVDRAWFRKILKSAADLRSEYVDSGSTTAFRLVNAEGDGLPGITVDRYGDYLMLQFFTEAWRPHVNDIAHALNDIFKPAGIYEKFRPRNTREIESSGNSGKMGRLVSGPAAPERMVVRENGLNFLVSLESGLNTGLFLDQRENRLKLMKHARGKRVLNLFSYTGAFSISAAASGAKHVTSVDASAAYTQWALENFRINGIDTAHHDFVTGDCEKALTSFASEGRIFDIVIMDPPSFSTTSGSTFTTRGGTSGIAAAVLPLLEQGGTLITSSNHQKVDIADYLKELRRGALKAGSDLRIVEISGQGPDFPFSVTFPEGRYLKYVTSIKAA